MEFRQLGPLELVEDGVTVRLGGPRQRALLSFLLIHRNEPVSTERIVDALWETEAPRTAAQIVRVYVSQLRKLLGPDVLVTHGNGYVLRVAEEDVDVNRFEQRVGEARRLLAAGEAVAAVEAFDDALSLCVVRRCRSSPTTVSLSLRSRGSRSFGSRRWKIGSTPRSPPDGTVTW